MNAMSAEPKRVPVMPVAISLGVFLSISFVLCIALGLLVPDGSFHKPWLQFLPGVSWLTWSSFLLGLCESLLYGLYIGFVFVPLYNFFARMFVGAW
jgi:uncharacterized protein involved in cysteine biosynthesis